MNPTTIMPTVIEETGTATVVNATPLVVSGVIPCTFSRRVDVFVEAGTANIASISLVFSAANGAISVENVLAGSALAPGVAGGFSYTAEMGQAYEVKITPTALGGGTLTYWTAVGGA